MTRELIALIFGYILAAMFTTSVSMTPALTLWGSLWTYVAILGFTVFGWVLIFFALLVLGALAASAATPRRRW